MLHMERDMHYARGNGKTAGAVEDETFACSPVPRKLRGLDPDVLAQLRRPRTLRRGLPGDGTPVNARQAAALCPHKTVHQQLMPDGRGGYNTHVAIVGPGEHVCIGGWLL
jgi:hypothetical protein